MTRHAGSPPLPLGLCRRPIERVVFAGFVLLNTAILICALRLAMLAPDWLESHPMLKKRVEGVQPVLMAIVLAVPALPLLRNTRRASIRGNSVKIGPEQVPEIWNLFLEVCRTLRVPPPELYFTTQDIGGPSGAYSTLHRDYIVLRIDYLQADLEAVKDVILFHLGREVGRIRCGHTRWWDELLLSYVRRLPVLRNPLLHLRTFAHDRHGAVAAEGNLSGLVGRAAGRRMLPLVNQSKMIEEALRDGGFWARLSSLMSAEPHLSERIRQLYRSGLIPQDGGRRKNDHE